MYGCAAPDLSALKDTHAERMILCGLLHDGRELAEKLSDFPATDFSDDTNSRAFCLFCYVGLCGDGPILADAFVEAANRANLGLGWLDGNFGRGRDIALWLADLWTTDMWLGLERGQFGLHSGMRLWADPASTEASFHTWATLAAAAKCRHLAARRRAYYAATEVMAEATRPTGDADQIDRATNDLGEM